MIMMMTLVIMTNEEQIKSLSFKTVAAVCLREDIL